MMSELVVTDVLEAGQLQSYRPPFWRLRLLGCLRVIPAARTRINPVQDIFAKKSDLSYQAWRLRIFFALSVVGEGNERFTGSCRCPITVQFTCPVHNWRHDC